MEKKRLSRSLTTALLISVLFLFLTAGCKEDVKPSMSGVFTFIKGTVTKNGEVAKLGSAVKEGDLLASQKNSTAVVQFSGGALLTLRGGSELQVSALAQRQDGKKVVSLAQKKGSTFSKIVSSENVDYSVSAPTLTAGVRGTSFEMNVSKSGGTEIKLFKGKVAVAPDKTKLKKGKSGKELLLESGKKVKVTKNHGVSEPQALTKKDKKALKVMDTIELVPNIEAGSDSDAPQTISLPKEVSDVISEDFQEYTLEDLRKEYGALSKIVTKSGEIYIGNFLQRKEDVMIRTTDGQFTIAADKMKSVKGY